MALIASRHTRSINARLTKAYHLRLQNDCANTDIAKVIVILRVGKGSAKAERSACSTCLEMCLDLIADGPEPELFYPTDRLSESNSTQIRNHMPWQELLQMPFA